MSPLVPNMGVVRRWWSCAVLDTKNVLAFLQPASRLGMLRQSQYCFRPEPPKRSQRFRPEHIFNGSTIFGPSPCSEIHLVDQSHLNKIGVFGQSLFNKKSFPARAPTLTPFFIRVCDKVTAAAPSNPLQIILAPAAQDRPKMFWNNSLHDYCYVSGYIYIAFSGNCGMGNVAVLGPLGGCMCPQHQMLH